MGNPLKLSPMEAALNKERAGAVSLSGVFLSKALAEWRAAERALENAAIPQRAKLETLCNDALREASRRLWNLIVQREALGLARHDDVYDQYQIPRALVPSPK